MAGSASLSSSSSTSWQPSAAVDASTRYLVQYNTSSNCLVQAIVQRTDISWPMGKLKVGKKVLILDNNTHRLAVILGIDTTTRCQLALEKLRQTCQQHVSNCLQSLRYHKHKPLEAHTWLLVYYTHGDNLSQMLAVVSVNDIIWRGKNYSCSFIRAADGRLCEASIWCLSKHYQTLENSLNELRLLQNVGKPKKSTNRLNKRHSYHLLPTIEESDNEVMEENCLNYYYHYLRLDDKQKLLRLLDQLEDKLRHDTVDIDYSTQAVARSCRKVDNLLDKLNANSNEVC